MVHILPSHMLMHAFTSMYVFGFILHHIFVVIIYDVVMENCYHDNMILLAYYHLQSHMKAQVI